MVLLSLLMLSVLLARRRGAPTHHHAATVCGRERPRHSPAGIGCLIGALVLVPLVLFCLASLLLYSWVALDHVERGAVVASSGGSDSSWKMDSNGPVISATFAQLSGLSARQREEANNALQSAFREYLELEKEYSEREVNEAGHVITTIKPFPAPVAALEDRLWSQLDQILDVRQQALARHYLQMHTPREGGHFGPQLARPGILGWGRDGCRIEIWRVGTWYHWSVTVEGFSHSSANGPQLPTEYERFWPGPRPPHAGEDQLKESDAINPAGTGHEKTRSEFSTPLPLRGDPPIGGEMPSGAASRE
jgi:hypothetical protein